MRMSLTTDFVQDIERKIITGEWRVGNKIPPLRDLAESFGVSRSVVNAGIVELQNKGYIVTIPRKYSIVADWKRRGTFAVLKGIVENEQYDENFVGNILDARMTIECAAVKDAAIKRTAEDISELREVLSAEERTVTIDERIAADIAFHHTVAVASHNIIYPMLLKSFEDMVEKFVTFFYQKNCDRIFVYSRHKIIYDAIVAGDVGLAEETMKSLLKQGEDIVRELYKV